MSNESSQFILAYTNSSLLHWYCAIQWLSLFYYISFSWFLSVDTSYWLFRSILFGYTTLFGYFWVFVNIRFLSCIILIILYGFWLSLSILCICQCHLFISFGFGFFVFLFLLSLSFYFIDALCDRYLLYNYFYLVHYWVFAIGYLIGGFIWLLFFPYGTVLLLSLLRLFS